MFSTDVSDAAPSSYAGDDTLCAIFSLDTIDTPGHCVFTTDAATSVYGIMTMPGHTTPPVGASRAPSSAWPMDATAAVSSILTNDVKNAPAPTLPTYDAMSIDSWHVG
jgi:hypothetical protein